MRKLELCEQNAEEMQRRIVLLEKEITDKDSSYKVVIAGLTREIELLQLEVNDHCQLQQQCPSPTSENNKERASGADHTSKVSPMAEPSDGDTSLLPSTESISVQNGQTTTVGIVTAVQPMETSRHSLKEAACKRTLITNESVPYVSPCVDIIPQQVVSDKNQEASTTEIASSLLDQAVTTADGKRQSDFENSVFSVTSPSNKRHRLDEQTIPDVSEYALGIQYLFPTLSQRDSGVTSKAESTSNASVKVIEICMVL